MSDREQIIEMIKDLPESKLVYARIYIEGLRDGAEEEDPFYSKENQDELKRRIQDLKSGRSTLKEHTLIEDV